MVKQGDTVEVKAKDKAKNSVRENLELTKDRTVPSWLEFNNQELKASVLRLPEKEDLQSTIQEQLIVELYSK